MTTTPQRRPSRAGSRAPGRSGAPRPSSGRTSTARTDRPSKDAAATTAVRSRSTATTRTVEVPATPATAADRAYDRRRRRTERMADARLENVGAPIRERLHKIPFVVVVIAVLALGGGSVLYLNTMTDEAGIRTNRSEAVSDDLRLEIESLQRDISALDATPEIARKARELGLVPAGESAIIDCSKGACRIVGTPQKPGAATGTAGH